MPRSVNKVASRARRKKILDMAKGYWGRRKNVYTIAKNHVEKGLTHAYSDRRLKKRDYRSLWIVRINAAARQHGLSYSVFMHKLKENNVHLNRKVLSAIALDNPEVFASIVNTVKN
ncbi:MAG: 50S ribosomal protein L20 [Ignavibacteriaceae bacterium]|nr:50S ribosomal protein L20 [Ignavibacteriaceae bacterium]NUM70077.1 50S ribosomal protein L20 [Ignavibacteriaceae bacterium]